MRAGKLRHLVTLQSPSTARGSAGGTVDAWSDVATVHASIEPLQGREFIAAQQGQARVSHRVTIRYRAGVVPSMRVSFGARLFRIEAVLNTGERNIEQQLMCLEDVKA